MARFSRVFQTHTNTDLWRVSPASVLQMRKKEAMVGCDRVFQKKSIAVTWCDVCLWPPLSESHTQQPYVRLSGVFWKSGDDGVGLSSYLLLSPSPLPGSRWNENSISSKHGASRSSEDSNIAGMALLFSSPSSLLLFPSRPKILPRPIHGLIQKPPKTSSWLDLKPPNDMYDAGITAHFQNTNLTTA